MKKLFVFLSLFLLVLNLAPANLYAETAEAMAEIQKQKDECAKQANKAWDSARNRCIITQESKTQKNSDQAAGKECLAISDLEKRKTCFLDYANKNADVSKNLAGESATRGLERGVTTAYSVLSMIQMFGSGSGSNCTSKTIFGITSMAGTLTDLYMKVQAKKKLKSLQNKYSIDLETNAYDAQVKALEYLKDEQIVLKDIANQEKKRNMVMMAGYAAAAGVAAYEMFTQSKCASGPQKPAPQPETQAEVVTQAAAPAQPATPAADTPLPELKKPVEFTPSEPIKLAEIENKPLSAISTEKLEMTGGVTVAKLSQFDSSSTGKSYVFGTLGDTNVNISGNTVYDAKTWKPIANVGGDGFINLGDKKYYVPDSIPITKTAPSWTGKSTPTPTGYCWAAKCGG